ncbi:MAG: S-methyl-5-thioribose-1-phosphate isomerase [Ancalomicrobiaceae bacterium]|nr:S-methyl-5-thioribose-1-phosphate isomerase [Ancalomicrobiaceae bacterium]
MQVDGQAMRTIWRQQGDAGVFIIDQTQLPHRFVTRRLATVADAAEAILAMQVRGAPLIGAAAAYGMALAAADDPTDSALAAAADLLAGTRPTAVNLQWAVSRVLERLTPLPAAARALAAAVLATDIAEQDIGLNRAMGAHGVKLIEAIAAEKGPGQPVNILTHCNAGWLATVDRGTATAPIYEAYERGIAIHVYVDETRPRNQGASLTAWELGQQGVAHTVIPDNTGGHLMQHGLVDLVIVGTDRTTATGDVCNKIGTYLKALAAKDNGVPFYVAAPSPSIDFALRDGVAEIPIEQRSAAEVTHMTGVTAAGTIETVRITPEGSPVANYGFDVTPARLVSGLITERGVIAANAEALAAAFPERMIA